MGLTLMLKGTSVGQSDEGQCKAGGGAVGIWKVWGRERRFLVPDGGLQEGPVRVRRGSRGRGTHGPAEEGGGRGARTVPVVRGTEPVSLGALQRGSSSTRWPRVRKRSGQGGDTGEAAAQASGLGSPPAGPGVSCSPCLCAAGSFGEQRNSLLLSGMGGLR